MTGALERTPLFEEHRALGGRLVPFAGYEMPVQYAGVVAEHTAVRSAAGLFDVSHMGRLRLSGPEACAVVDGLVTNNVGRLKAAHALYTVAVNDNGTILDDLIVYRTDADVYLVVCNASNRGKIAPIFAAAAKGRCDYVDESDDTALLAIQGPKATMIAEKAGAPASLRDLGRFAVHHCILGGHHVLVARTGYTGEDGYEIFCANKDAPGLWRQLLAAGEPEGLLPCGLGARDTLRLEAALSLYGNEIDESTNPFEAGLGWVVKLKNREFVGADALRRLKAAGLQRKLCGLVMTGRGIARHGYPVVDGEGVEIGHVTSGSPGPTVGKNIALAYLPIAHAETGRQVAVKVRSKVVPAEVVDTPFYRRPE